MPYRYLHLILGGLTMALVLTVVYGIRPTYYRLDWTYGVLSAAAVWVMWAAVALSQVVFGVEVPSPVAWVALGWAAIYSTVTLLIYIDYDPSGGLGHYAIGMGGIGLGLLIAAGVFVATFLSSRAD